MMFFSNISDGGRTILIIKKRGLKRYPLRVQQRALELSRTKAS